MSGDSNKKLYIRDLTEGQSIDSIFVITRVNLKEYDGGHFLALRFGDRTGKVSGVMWSNALEAAKTLEEGMLVQVVGQTKLYKGEVQLTVHRISPAPEDVANDPSFFLPISKIPSDQLISEFDHLLQSFDDPDYKSLLQALRDDDELWRKFSVAPAAKTWHHAYLHGLLEHTLSVMNLCRMIAPLYPDVDQDLLITGAVFHDSGKIDELTYDTHLGYSTDGRLLGHTYIGAFLAERLMERSPGFPAEKRRKLLHMILSHHGEVERSPITPMTQEALLLHSIENMDAQMNAFSREMDAARSSNREWTSYVNLIGRFLYVGENEKS